VLESEIVSGEFEASLVIVTVPVTLPEVAGVNTTFMVADTPGLRMSPVETPFTTKLAPEIVTLEMLIFELPELVSVTDCVPLLPMFMFPKAMLEALELS
jgi:hypothetical protein